MRFYDLLNQSIKITQISLELIQVDQISLIHGICLINFIYVSSIIILNIFFNEITHMTVDNENVNAFCETAEVRLRSKQLDQQTILLNVLQ